MVDEGSAFVDGIDSDAEVDEDTSNEVTETTGTSEDTEVKEESKETPKTEEKEEVAPLKVTDKGTQLDENPLSAANQQRANAERRAKIAESVLTDPDKFWQYAEAAGFHKKVEEPEVVIAPEKLETIEGVTEVVNDLVKQIKTVRDENTKLRSGLGKISEDQEHELLKGKIMSEISLVRENYPELNPKSGPEKFVEPLEKEVGQLFDELDFDGQGYKGEVSLASITKRMMKAYELGKQAGSVNAQTVIKDKTKGQVKTGGGKTTDVDESSLTPAQVIAKRIAKFR